MMRLSFSDAAAADLEEIGDLIAEKSPSRAASFVYELREACVGLLKYPKRFPLLRVGGNGGFRQRIVANYRVVYQVRADAIFIVRILHGARDHERMLFPED